MEKGDNSDYVLVSKAIAETLLGGLLYYEGYYRTTSSGVAMPVMTNDYVKAIKIPYKDEAERLCNEINKDFAIHSTELVVQDHCYFKAQP